MFFISIYLFDMNTYGIDFPFRDSAIGNYLKMTSTPEREVRANLIHLLLTRKGSRYFLPDFGTRLYEYIFEQNDVVTFNHIEDEIREGVKKYIPNLDINSITITSAEDDPENPPSPQEQEDSRLFRVSNDSSKPYTAKVKIDYTVNNGAFSTSDFIIINI
jgi:phage baseplate assembly protein W